MELVSGNNQILELTYLYSPKLLILVIILAIKHSQIIIFVRY